MKPFHIFRKENFPNWESYGLEYDVADPLARMINFTLLKETKYEVNLVFIVLLDYEPLRVKDVDFKELIKFASAISFVMTPAGKRLALCYNYILEYDQPLPTIIKDIWTDSLQYKISNLKEVIEHSSN